MLAKTRPLSMMHSPVLGNSSFVKKKKKLDYKIILVFKSTINVLCADELTETDVLTCKVGV